MPSATVKSAYHAGIRQGAPFVFVAAPFALLFGVVAIEAGMTLAQAMGFSIVVIAGAAQFAAMQLMVENASIVLVISVALAVNLRMAMYSAALVPYIGAAPLWQRALIAYINFDHSFIASMTEYEAKPEMTVPARAAFFLGVSTPLVPIWIIMTYIGAQVGAAIPPEYALDFALPITFLSMIGPLLRTLAHVSAALTSTLVGLALVWMPSGTGLLVAAVCAMCVGALVETWQEGRA